ncbi:MAG: hypothetical protein GWO24_35760, partial [Akkermansiaceae bacterium]|nr:hypothetical protein [Akkermansiaceae bacterium]
EAPTAIALSSNVIPVDSPPGATIGTIETTDPDPSDHHAYALVAGPGDADN